MALSDAVREASAYVSDFVIKAAYLPRDGQA